LVLGDSLTHLAYKERALVGAVKKYIGS